jgi:hypothetical protein
MSDALPERGDRKKVEGRWLTCTSAPHPHRPGLHVWRSGEHCVTPEWADFAAERRATFAPIPPVPAPKYAVVQMGA